MLLLLQSVGNQCAELLGSDTHWRRFLYGNGAVLHGKGVYSQGVGTGERAQTESAVEQQV